VIWQIEEATRLADGSDFPNIAIYRDPHSEKFIGTSKFSKIINPTTGKKDVFLSAAYLKPEARGNKYYWEGLTTLFKSHYDDPDMG